MAEFDVVDRKTLSKQIAEQLLAMLREGQLKPGDQLPPERELAARMQVSRPSLREALRALAIMNVLEVRQGAGTFVTSLETDLLLEHLDFVVSLDDSSLLDLFEARKIVELGIVDLAAQRITDEELAELEQGLSRTWKTVDDAAAFLEADADLHKAITRSARNPIMSRVIDSIDKLLLLSRSRTIELPGVRHRTAEDHEAIVTALAQRDAERAREAMLQHLNHVEQAFVDSEPWLSPRSQTKEGIED